MYGAGHMLDTLAAAPCKASLSASLITQSILIFDP